MLHRLGKSIGYLLLISAFAIHALVVVLFHFRWDKLAMATVFPVWLYAIAAFGILIAARFFIKTRWIPAVAIVWLITLPFLADEATGLRNLALGYRPVKNTEVTDLSPNALRIITINAKSGSSQQASEIAAWNPDIVLMQETPGHHSVRQLGQQLFGKDSVIQIHRHCTIIARGKSLRMIPMPRTPSRLPPRGIVSQLTLLDGRVLNIVNVHLDSATVKLSAWSPETWRDHANNRRRRRESLGFMMAHETLLPDVQQGYIPTIVAGDFNAPAGDASTRMLQNDYIDTYTVCGVGWGNTFPSGLPIHRIDQIWLDRRLDPLGLSAEKVSDTDHCMVVCDFIFRP